MRRSDRKALVATAILVLSALAAEAPAFAYCRTSSCGGKGTGAVCTPAQPTDCGIPLFWPSPCVSYSIQKDASKRVDFTTTQQLLKQAFSTWQNADCAGSRPRIEMVEFEPADCTKHEYNQDRGNANLIVFRDDGWPYAGSNNTLALTTVTYNLDNGEIYDADMELNSATINITVGNKGIQYDFLSILTHEAGHFLGIAHSATPVATMFPDYKQGDTGLRDLDEDDAAAICAVYPSKDPIPASCDPTPRHGFSTKCGADQSPGEAEEGGCSCRLAATTSPASYGGASAALSALLLAVWRRRHGSFRRSKPAARPSM